MHSGRGRALLRLLGTAVIMQAMLSGCSFLVGLILIRRATDIQYGYFVLITNAVMLLNAVQNAFVMPQMVTRMTRGNLAERADVIGGLFRDQHRLWPALMGFAAVSVLVLRLSSVVTDNLAIILITGAAAVIASMYRESIRMVLLGYRLPGAVLGADVYYVIIAVLGVALATLATAPAALAALAVCVASIVGGLVASRSLWRYEAWNRQAAPGILRQIAPLGLWSASGAAIHWAFSQGYNYLVAGTLDMSAVAAIAATRLLMMPVNLLSAGISTQIYSMTAVWLNTHRATIVLWRLCMIASALALLAICYIAMIWFLKDWIFLHLLKKNFPRRDLLLALWSIIAILMLFRDQLGYLLAARARFRSYSFLTLLSAIASLSISYFAMHRVGVIGALIGVMAGELLNVLGLIVLSVREARVHGHAGA